MKNATRRFRLKSLFNTISNCILLGCLTIGVSACVVVPAPPEAEYGAPCCYAYYDYPVIYAHPYYGYGPGGYWGGYDRRRR